MPYFSVDQVDASITYLVGTTHSALASMLAMWRERAPVSGAGVPIKFGSREENRLFNDFFSPEGAPQSSPYFIPFHKDQGKTRWRDKSYAGSSLQRQRTGMRDVFVSPDLGKKLNWSFSTDYVTYLISQQEKAIGRTPISLPALAAWMLREREFADMEAAVDMLVAEVGLDRDGLIGTAAAPSVFTRDDTAGIGEPISALPVEEIALLQVLAKHSAPPLASSASSSGAHDDSSTSPIVDPDAVEGDWDFDPALLHDLGPLEGLYGPAFTAAAALRRGAHVIFVGPPGTGKTTLAKRLCKLAEIPYKIVTATDQWTTFETIGGYFPTPTKESGFSERLDFLPGLMFESIVNGQALIVDELNRADMDKAFGELFTLLTGQSVDLPFRMRSATGFDRIRLMPKAGMVEEGVYGVGVPSWWRMIGAMNDADKGGIRRLSQAFKRRFALVVVPLPTPDIYRSILEKDAARLVASASAPSLFPQFLELLVKLFATPGSGFAAHGFPMGPAIPRSMLKAALSEWDLDAKRTLDEVADSILESQVAPLLSGASAKIDDILKEVSQHLGDVSRFKAALRIWSGR